jgi:uncharacterized pyridoxamine 5'-phosphate oxidase family protein
MDMKNNMPKELLIKYIRQFLKEQKVLVLCTSSDDTPRATPMDFYLDKNSNTFTLYVGPSPGKKVDNILKNPKVSIGIYGSMDSGKIQGMQITATGRDHLIFLKEGEEEFELAQKIVWGQRKLILKIIPEKIELLDYDFVKEGYSRFQVLEL